ncbi:hypothetical protein HIM_11022 [Hirsutella minnesotensis 3608]|uniref:Uncharacterized protein n=1 Tax=Hirsutella minnesotensis 3608 TaxID=1043627 RepID=A0A0F7ZJE4_9HYPO|nr:hypothetical protein HIM_11022 [Hirsutella minnesotensis 3608]
MNAPSSPQESATSMSVSDNLTLAQTDSARSRSEPVGAIPSSGSWGPEGAASTRISRSPDNMYTSSPKLTLGQSVTDDRISEATMPSISSESSGSSDTVSTSNGNSWKTSSASFTQIPMATGYTTGEGPSAATPIPSRTGDQALSYLNMTRLQYVVTTSSYGSSNTFTTLFLSPDMPEVQMTLKVDGTRETLTEMSSVSYKTTSNLKSLHISSQNVVAPEYSAAESLSITTSSTRDEIFPAMTGVQDRETAQDNEFDHITLVSSARVTSFRRTTTSAIYPLTLTSTGGLNGAGIPGTMVEDAYTSRLNPTRSSSAQLALSGVSFGLGPINDGQADSGQRIEEFPVTIEANTETSSTAPHLPNDYAGNLPERTVPIQIGFLAPLRYEVVSKSAKTAAKIRRLLPQALSDASDISITSIKLYALDPYDTRDQWGYITTVARLYYPESLVEKLQMDLWLPSSRLYNNGDVDMRKFTALINPRIDVRGSTNFGDARDHAYPSDTIRPSESGTSTSSSEEVQAEKRKGTTIGVTVGAADAAKQAAPAL